MPASKDGLNRSFKAKPIVRPLCILFENICFYQPNTHIWRKGCPPNMTLSNCNYWELFNNDTPTPAPKIFFGTRGKGAHQEGRREIKARAHACMEEPSTANSIEDYRWIISPSPWSNVRPSRPLITIVDDDASIRKALARLIVSFNLEVATFGSGKEFLESLAVRLPDCLLLDLHMPGMSGIDVMTALASQGWALPIIIVTGHHEPALRARCLALGALAYLSKTVDPGRLLQAIGEALGVSNSSSATERDRARQ